MCFPVLSIDVFIFFTANQKQLQHIACKLGVGQASPQNTTWERTREGERVKGQSSGSRKADRTLSNRGQGDTDGMGEKERERMRESGRRREQGRWTMRENP